MLFALSAAACGSRQSVPATQPPPPAPRQESAPAPTYLTTATNPFTGEPLPERVVDWRRMFAGLPADLHPPSAWENGGPRPGWILFPDAAPSTTRLGGEPALADDQQWPVRGGRPLQFLAQIDFAELATQAGALPAPFPQQGVLSLFIEDPPPWGLATSDRERFALLYTTDAVRNRAGATPAHWPLAYLRGQATTVAPVEAVTREEDRPHLVGGQPQWIQYGPSLPQVHLTSGTYSKDVAATLRRAGVRIDQIGSRGYGMADVVAALERAHEDPRDVFKGAEDWLVIWQIPSRDALGFTFYDEGTIYVLMRPADLAARAFDRAWIDLDCM
jgi:hypothetical protein